MFTIENTKKNGISKATGFDHKHHANPLIMSKFDMPGLYEISD
jgi:hypothetical protein